MPLSQTTLAQIQHLTLAGKKIEAVKLMREVTGLGLKESKEAVEALEAGQSLDWLLTGDTPAPGLADPQDPDSASRAALLALVQAGKKIDAIKLYRQWTGLGLKEAKDAIEALEAEHPVQFSSATSLLSTRLSSVHAAVQAGDKIEAIRLYREVTGSSLAEAKAAVEKMLADQSFPAIFRADTSGIYHFSNPVAPSSTPSPLNGRVVMLMVVGLLVVFIGVAAVIWFVVAR
jgi:ribosomal protein L7/L12